MNKRIYVWQTLGFIFVSFMGVLLHFLFELTGKRIITAAFSAVNESTFEHMKILFFPMLFFAFIENYFIGKEYKNFWYIKFIGIVISVVLIPVLFYTVNGVFGETADFINISIFFVSAALGFFYESKLFKKNSLKTEDTSVFLVILVILAFIFVLFTFKTPHIPLFKDPLTGSYGYFK